MQKHTQEHKKEKADNMKKVSAFFYYRNKLSQKGKKGITEQHKLENIPNSPPIREIKYHRNKEAKLMTINAILNSVLFRSTMILKMMA